MSRRLRRSASDEGSALVIALLFVTSFSLFIASVISFAEVGLRAARTYDLQTEAAYATDGAVNAAINRRRIGGPCDDYRAPSWPASGTPGVTPPPSVIVRCEDENRPASAKATRPVNALLSLGPEGITTTTEQRVLGNIFSNSTVKAGARLIVQGAVSALGNCTRDRDIQTLPDAGARSCLNLNNPPGADPSEGRDPDYTAALQSLPQRRAVPTCPAGWLVTLEPGHYDDADALSAFTSDAGSCTGKVVWLKPGNYSFDFTFRGGNGTWLVSDPAVVVVAGSPKDWDPAAPTRPASLAGAGAAPGSCLTPSDPRPTGVQPVGGPPPAVGVQIAVGGGSHVQMDAGQVELCAEPSTTGQSIALYGVPARPTGYKHTLEPTDWTAVRGFTDPADATVIGEVPVAGSTAVLSSGATGDAAITLTGFRPGVPEGALIQSARLRVSHQDVGDLDADSITVGAAFLGSSCAGTGARPLPVRTALAEDTVDLVADCGLRDPADIAGLAVTYSVALAASGASARDTLDGIAVDVVYRTPTTVRPTASSATGFTDPANALEIGEQPAALTAAAALSPAAPSAALTVSGLGGPPLAPGSRLDSVVLRVAHRDQGDMARPTVTVPIPGGTCRFPALTAQPAGIVEERLDLKACGLDDPAELLGLTATYEVALTSMGTAATADLDGMWLEVVSTPPPVLTAAPATVTSSAASPTTAAFNSPENARAVGEQPAALTADAVLRKAAPTASLTLAGFDVPPGSVLDSALLRVAHQDTGTMATPELAVAFPGVTADTRCTSPVLTKRAAVPGEDLIDLRACGLSDATRAAGLTVTYSATLTGGTTTPPDATAKVDGVVLDLTYRPAAVRAPGTATATGFTNPDNAKATGGSATPPTADATLIPGATPASITLNGYDAGVPLPAGSVVDSAVLRVVHQEDPWSGPITLAAAFPGNTCSQAQPVPPASGSFGTFRSANLSSCGLTRVEQLAGLSATYAVNPPATADSTQTATTTSAVTAFQNPDNARAADGVTADATFDGALATSASVTLGGYGQGAPPAGSTLGSALLRVSHQEDVGVVAVTATATFPGGTCAPQTFTPRTALGVDTIDLKACGLTDPAKLTDLAVTFSTELEPGAATPAVSRLDAAEVAVTYTPPAATERLDGIELDLVYRAPAVRSLDGCVTDPDPARACALVRVAPAAGDTVTRFVVQGTVYAPTAPLDIEMAGLTEQVLTRGLVARTIRLGLKAATGYSRPLIGVPPEPVKFTAYPDVVARPTDFDPPTTFTRPTNAYAIDGATAVATLAAGGPTSASLRLTKVVPPVAGPLEAAVLRVKHRVDPDVRAELTVEGLSAGPCAPVAGVPATFPLTPYPQLGEDQIDLTACGLTDTSQFGALKLSYTTLGSGVAGAAELDGITLDLLSGPLLRARVTFDASSQGPVTVQGWSVLR